MKTWRNHQKYMYTYAHSLWVISTETVSSDKVEELKIFADIMNLYLLLRMLSRPALITLALALRVGPHSAGPGPGSAEGQGQARADPDLMSQH